MKKISYVIVIALCLCLSFAFFACSDSKPTENHDSTIYTISCETSDLYTFGGTVNSTAGETATVNITSNYPALEITGCTFNNEACTKTETVENTTKFTYTMPAKNVEIKVQYRWKDLNVSGYNNFLSFSSDNEYTAKSAFGDSSYNNDVNWGSPLVLNFDTNANSMTIAEMTCISADENILPTHAIEVKQITNESTNNTITGGKIIIDRSKAQVGSTQIVLRVKSGNNSSYDAIIVATVTFTE